MIDGRKEKDPIVSESSPLLLKEEEERLFIKLEEDCQDIKGDIEEQASIVYGFADSRLERVP